MCERAQSTGEEIANSVSHGAALVAAAVAAPFPIIAAARGGTAADIVGASVFAATMVLLTAGLLRRLVRHRQLRLLGVWATALGASTMLFGHLLTSDFALGAVALAMLLLLVDHHFDGKPLLVAAAGAATGLLMGTAIGAGNSADEGRSAQQRYDIAYEQCMVSRNNQSSRHYYRQPASVVVMPQAAPAPMAPAYPAGSYPPPPPGSPPPPPPGMPLPPPLPPLPPPLPPQ